MSSPSIQHSVSDPKLLESHISSTRNHDFPPKPSKMVSRAKLGSKSDHPSLTLKHFLPYNMNESGHSPYYKGLLDQSLVIRGRQLEQNDNENQIQIPTFHASSPYYKGLLDQSLVISSSGHDLFQNHAISNSLAEVMSSPYYKGLLDQSLVVRARQIAENVSYSGPLGNHAAGSSSNSMILSIMQEFGFCFSSKSKEEIKNKFIAETGLKPGQSSSSEPKSNKTDLNMKELERKEVHNELGLIVEEEELGERVSEEIKEKTTVTEEMGLDIKKEINEYGLVGEEEKPLRESLFVSGQIIVSETACKDGDATNEKLNIDVNDKGIERKYTWADKHRPKSLDDFICNKEKAIQLKELISKGCGCKHFIFEGPPCVGKRSMIRAMLGELFGADRVKVIEEYKSFSLKGEMVGSIQVRIKKSAHHVEVNLLETKGYEKHVIVDLFKETYAKIINKSLPCSPDNCQAIILYEAEKLSTESMLYIKWLLERHDGCNKVFFCCSDESKLQVVKPLCITVHLASPSSEEIADILALIAKQEAIELCRDFAMKIVEKSKNNLRQAIRSFEATWLNKPDLKDDQIILTGWEDDISNIAKSIIEEQSPKQLYNVRRKLQTLMIHNVPPDFIFKALIAELNSLVDESLRSGFAKLYKEYNISDETKLETNKQHGQSHKKQEELEEQKSELTKKNATNYLKVEEFIAKFMSWYKNSSGKKKE